MVVCISKVHLLAEEIRSFFKVPISRENKQQNYITIYLSNAILNVVEVIVTSLALME